MNMNRSNAKRFRDTSSPGMKEKRGQGGVGGRKKRRGARTQTLQGAQERKKVQRKEKKSN